MSSKGFESSAFTYIRLIRDNLHDRYHDGFPILKEIIQNADDSSDATEFHYGWCPGLKDGGHPLLAGPAVFFVNNGSFEPHDEKAIRQFGFGYKAVDKATVGKFGLGLKSVFHWCEAFLYVYSTPAEPSSSELKGDILNPWSSPDLESSKHTNWNECPPSTLERIRSYIAPTIGPQKFFCLWLPLRRQQDLDGVMPIIEAYPGDEPVPSSPDTAPWGESKLQVAGLLPMLKRIRKIECWMPGIDGSTMQRAHSARLEDGSLQRRFPDEAHTRGVHYKVQGNVVLNSLPDGSGTKPWSYAGIETWLRNEKLESIQSSKFWPKDIGTNKDTGGDEQKPEKAEPNVSVSFMSLPRAIPDQSQLRIAWGVFLPVGEDTECCKLSIDFDVRLMLHGYLFLDAGRKVIENKILLSDAEITDEAGIRSKWNSELRKSGIFPLVIPSFQEWIARINASDSVIEAVTGALSKANVILRHIPDITRDVQWVFRSRLEGANWTAVEAAANVYTIPTPPASDPRRPYTVFPALGSISVARVVTFADKPSITSKRAIPWDASSVDLLLSSISVADVFTSTVYLDYLVDFLCLQDFDESSSISMHTKRILQEAFRNIPISTLRKSTSTLQRLFSHLPEGWLISVPESNPLHAELVQYFAVQDLGVILVPTLLWRGNSQAQYSETTILGVMGALGNAPRELRENRDFPQACAQLVLQILKSGEYGALLSRDDVRSLPVFVVFDVLGEAEKLVSLDAIAEANNHKTTFTFGFQAPREGIARTLQKALPNSVVLLMDGETYRYATRTEGSYPCTPSNALEHMKLRPSLGSAKSRGELLSTFLKHEDGMISSDSRKVYRYLLHGSSENYSSDVTLVAHVQEQEQGLWGRLYRVIVERKGLVWTCVPVEVSVLLNPSQRHELGVVSADSNGTARLLVDHSDELTSLEFDFFTDRDRVQILEEIKDTTVIKNLRIHPTTRGDYTRIDEHTFLEDGIIVCSYFHTKLNIVKRHPDAQLLKRQSELIPPLSPEQVVREVMSVEKPVEHWRIIANALSKIPVRNFNGVADLLKCGEWIPVRNGHAVAPKKILWIQGLEGLLTGLKISTELGYVGKSEILGELWRHDGFKMQRDRILPGPDERLEMLGEVLSESGDYNIGLRIESDEELECFVTQFKSRNLLPVADIIHLLREKSTAKADQINSKLLSHLVQSPTPEIIVAVLTFLAKEHEQSFPDQKRRCLYWHHRFLVLLRDCEAYEQLIPTIRLMNQQGQWKTTEGLCVGQTGIAPEDVLCDEQAEILASKTGIVGELEPDEAASSGAQDHAHRVEPESIEETIDAGVMALREYFRPWRGRVPEELIGAFLCCLGDHPEVRKLAEENLGQRSIEATREAFDWPTMLKPGTGFSETIQESMEKQRFLIRVIPGDSIEVESISRSRFHASMCQETKSVFVGQTFKTLWRDGLSHRVNHLGLRTIELDSFSSEGDLSSVLRRSVEELFLHVFLRKSSNLEFIWEELAKSEQLDVRIAQSLLLDSIFLILRQMGIDKSHTVLRKLLDRYDAIRKRMAEAQEKNNSANGAEAHFEEIYGLKQELRSKLEESSEIQSAILEALRRKISKDYQYTERSIPFELFQNADDATVELREMQKFFPQRSEDAPFVIVTGPSYLRIMHWGRPVNKFREGDFDGQDLGFGRDLEKMLLLSYSDKGLGNSDKSVTRKFGLGFKSLFLVTERPRMRSARIGVEIVGGMWPQILAVDSYEEMSRLLQEIRPGDRSGTMVELPALTTPSENILTDFRRLASILVAFSKAIKEIRICRDGKETSVVSWDPDFLSEDNSLAIAKMQLTPGEVPSSVLRVGAGKGALLFRIEESGLGKLPKDIPTIWVTAPTDEKSELGFAVNGPFPLDVGRAQLGRDPDGYIGLAHEVGAKLKQQMQNLYEVSSNDWSGFVGRLGMAPEIDPYTFWSSLWTLMVVPFVSSSCQSENNSMILVFEILWGKKESGIGSLLYEVPVVPTGLWDAHRLLVSTHDIEAAVEGILCDEHIFRQVCLWNATELLLKPGSTVSVSVLRSLEKLTLLSRTRVELVSICNLMETAVSRGDVVSTLQAEVYGDVVNKNLFTDNEMGPRMGKRESSDLLELLSSYKFFAHDGSRQSVRDLVVISETEHVDPDEILRGAFAPDDRVLSREYREAGIAFFVYCRPKLDAKAEEMEAWALSATTEDKRRGVLHYLLIGSLGRALGHRLRKTRPGSWLDSLRECQAYIDLDMNQRWELDGLLGIAPTSDCSLIMSVSDPEKVHLDAHDVLSRIYAWWASEKDSLTTEYEQKVYPSGTLNFLSPDFEQDDIEHRKSWYSLLMLGLTHTMGRTRPEQHRSFLSRCQDKGWLDVFAAKSASSDSWIGVLDNYIDDPFDREDFAQWMKLFPNLYRLSRYVDDYVESFLSVKRFARSFELSEVTALRTSTTHQGGGLDAPNLTRALGMGACFVLRELVRKQVVIQPLAHPHCFVPSKKTRMFISLLGCDAVRDEEGIRNSRHMYEFIAEYLGDEHATFSLSFDLPLILLLESNDLQRQVLGQVIPDNSPDTIPFASAQGDFVTLADGRKIPRNWMS